MNVTRHFFAFPRSPDDPAADPAPVVADPAADPAAAVEPAVSDPVEPDPAPAPVADAPAMPAWALERIGEETNKRRAAEEMAQQNAARVREYEEIVKRLQTDPKAPVDPAKPAPRTDAPSPSVQQEAANIVFQRDVATISENGGKAFGAKWNEAVSRLNAFGANSNEFVADVMAIDQARAHEIMFDISQDGEKAVALARMAPARRIAEITRMAMTKAASATDPKPEPKADPKPASDPKPAISKAPAPKPAIAPLAAAPEVDPRTPEGNDKMSDAEFNDWWKREGGKKFFERRVAH